MNETNQILGELADYYDRLCLLGVVRTPDDFVAYCNRTFPPSQLAELQELYQLHVGGSASSLDSAVQSGTQVIQSQADTYIGRFRVLDEIGEGGFGKVYRAVDGLGRNVALKVMRSQRPIAPERFSMEIEILSSLNHINIAHIYESDFLTDGRPCFTMELVEDRQEITEYCDRNSLSIKERLKLFLTLCEAIRYAHQMQVVELNRSA